MKNGLLDDQIKRVRALMKILLEITIDEPTPR
jgi:hypothetical protein